MGSRSAYATSPGTTGAMIPGVVARAAALVLLSLAATPSAPCTPAAGPPIEPLAHFPAGELNVDAGGRSYPFKVWIAATDARREQGLMFVKSLPPGRGMLFVFESPQLLSFWMKNTLIPLDLLFVAADGRVIRIAENAAPESLETISSMGAALGVLELVGGTAQRLGLKPGVRIRHPAFGTR